MKTENDWDLNDDGSVKELHTAGPNLSHIEQPASSEFRITAQAQQISKPALASPFQEGALPPELEEKLPSDLRKVLELLTVAQRDFNVRFANHNLRSPKNPKYTAALAKLNRIKKHFHSLQQDLATDHSASSMANFIVSPLRKKAVIESRNARIEEIKQDLRSDRRPTITQTHPVKIMVLKDDQVEPSLLAAYRAGLEFELGYLERLPDLSIEDTKEELRQLISAESDLAVRSQLIGKYEALNSPLAEDLQRMAATEIRAAYAPAVNAIKALSEACLARLKGLRDEAIAHERQVANTWGVEHSRTAASRQFDQLIAQLEEKTKPQPAQQVPFSHLHVPTPHGLLSWWGVQ